MKIRKPKKIKPEKKKGVKKNQKIATAAVKSSGFAGIAGAGLPCARNVCMRINGA